MAGATVHVHPLSSFPTFPASGHHAVLQVTTNLTFIQLAEIRRSVPGSQGIGRIVTTSKHAKKLSWLPLVTTHLFHHNHFLFLRTCYCTNLSSIQQTSAIQQGTLFIHACMHLWFMLTISWTTASGALSIESVRNILVASLPRRMLEWNCSDFASWCWNEPGKKNKTS